MDIPSREKTRLNKALKEINIRNSPGGTSKSAVAGGSKSSLAVSPLRQRQQEVLDQARNLRKKGMVGELTRIFLGQDYVDPEDEGEDEETNGIEGYGDDSRLKSETINKGRTGKEADTDDDDLTNLQKMYMDRLKTNPKTAKKDKKAKKEQEETDEEPGDFDDEIEDDFRGDFRKPNKEENSIFDPEARDKIDLSSIRSDHSEFTPNRKDVAGTKVQNMPAMPPSGISKQDSRVVFEKDQSGAPPSNLTESKKGSQSMIEKKPTNPQIDHDPNANLKVPRFNSQVFDSTAGNGKGNQKSPADTDREGALSNSPRKSNRDSASGGDRSASKGTVLGMKKRDKSNLMENLARIHAQREEDAKEMHENDDESDDNHQINWEQRIRELKEGKQQRKFRVPGERMDERAKRRKDRDRGLDKWGVLSVPRKRTFDKPKQLYKFKNDLNRVEKINITGVNIELLHTDELMAYYRELIMKGNRDLTDHQRLQNEIKKLEYEAVASKSPKGRSRSRGKKDSRGRSRSLGEKKLRQTSVKKEPAATSTDKSSPPGAVKTVEPTNVPQTRQRVERKRPDRSKTPTLGRKTVFN